MDTDLLRGIAHAVAGNSPPCPLWCLPSAEEVPGTKREDKDAFGAYTYGIDEHLLSGSSAFVTFSSCHRGRCFGLLAFSKCAYTPQHTFSRIPFSFSSTIMQASSIDIFMHLLSRLQWTLCFLRTLSTRTCVSSSFRTRIAIPQFVFLCFPVTHNICFSATHPYIRIFHVYTSLVTNHLLPPLPYICLTSAHLYCLLHTMPRIHLRYPPTHPVLLIGVISLLTDTAWDQKG